MSLSLKVLTVAVVCGRVLAIPKPVNQEWRELGGTIRPNATHERASDDSDARISVIYQNSLHSGFEEFIGNLIYLQAVFITNLTNGRMTRI